MAYTIASERKVVTLNTPTQEGSQAVAAARDDAADLPEGLQMENLYLSALSEAMEAFAARPGLLQSFKGLDEEEVTSFFAHIQPQTQIVRDGIRGIRYETAQKMVIKLMAQAWKDGRPIESVGENLVRFSNALGDTHFDPDEMRYEMLLEPEKKAQEMTEWTQMVRGISPHCFDERTHQPVTPEISAFLSDMMRYGVKPEHTGRAIRMAEDHMTPTGDGVFKWKEVSFLDSKVQYGIRFALAFQAARAMSDYEDGLLAAEREGRQKGFVHATGSPDRVVRNAIQASIGCANATEECPVPPVDQQEYFFRVCSAMREGMDSWHLYMNTLYKMVPKEPKDAEQYLATQARDLLDRARDRKEFLLSVVRDATPGQNVSALILTRASLMEGLRPLWRLQDNDPQKVAMLGSMSAKSAILSLEAGILDMSKRMSEASDRVTPSRAQLLVRKIAFGSITGQVRSIQAQVRAGVKVEAGELLRNVETSMRNGARLALNMSGLMQPALKQTLSQWSLPRIEHADPVDATAQQFASTPSSAAMSAAVAQ